MPIIFKYNIKLHVDEWKYYLNLMQMEKWIAIFDFIFSRRRIEGERYETIFFVVVDWTYNKVNRLIICLRSQHLTVKNGIFVVEAFEQYKSSKCEISYGYIMRGKLAVKSCVTVFSDKSRFFGLLASFRVTVV